MDKPLLPRNFPESVVNGFLQVQIARAYANLPILNIDGHATPIQFKGDLVCLTGMSGKDFLLKILAPLLIRLQDE